MAYISFFSFGMLFGQCFHYQAFPDLESPVMHSGGFLQIQHLDVDFLSLLIFVDLAYQLLALFKLS